MIATSMGEVDDVWVALDRSATPQEQFDRLNREHAERVANGHYVRAADRRAADRAASARTTAADLLAKGETGKWKLSESIETALAELRIEQEQAAVAAATIEIGTLANIDDSPPGPLLLDMLEPNGPTLLYAAPGVGKGTTGAHLVVEALNAGLRPMIFDAERRPREWSRRVAGLGGDRARVAYATPEDLGPALAGQPFWEMARVLGPVARDKGCDLFLLDSLVPASGVGEERLRSDAQAPFLFVKALDSLGMPSIAFGHPPKGQPEGEPFGSMAWVAAFRLTWLGTKAEGDGHRVRWRPRKRNERGHIPGLLMTYGYDDAGRLCRVDQVGDDENSRDSILALLVHGPMTVAAMAEDVADGMEYTAPGEVDRIKDRLARTLNRMKREGWIDRIGGAGGRGVQWRLREQA